MTAVTSPSAALAALTVDRLIEQGLLRAEKRDALIAKIASGTMMGDDWRIEVELANLKEAKP